MVAEDNFQDSHHLLEDIPRVVGNHHLPEGNLQQEDSHLQVGNQDLVEGSQRMGVDKHHLLEGTLAEIE